jgi:S-(hydroxymethyl)glutathione dehydrogenase/alcohol dehydrogenase
VVIGCGGVGLNVIQGAALVSGNPIIAVDIYDHKLILAKNFGATQTINSKNSDLMDEVHKIVGSSGADVVVENTGIVKLIELAYSMTTKAGKTILVGVPRHNEDVTIHTLPLHFGRVLTGCEGGQTHPTEDIPRYLKLYESGKLQLKNLITHRYTLVEINTALDKIRGGEVGRCVLNITN